MHAVVVLDWLWWALQPAESAIYVFRSRAAPGIEPGTTRARIVPLDQAANSGSITHIELIARVSTLVTIEQLGGHFVQCQLPGSARGNRAVVERPQRLGRARHRPLGQGVCTAVNELGGPLHRLHVPQRLAMLACTGEPPRRTSVSRTVWPSGVRCWLKAPFRKGPGTLKGVGSNPQLSIVLWQAMRFPQHG